MEEIPGEERCLLLLARHGVPERVISHSRKVTEIALKIAAPLLRRGLRLDMELLTAAGLLHDVAKGSSRHAEVGMEIISAWGYPQVAAVVGSHIDIIPAKDAPPGEAEILYLADKLVSGDRYIALEERFRESEKRFSGDAEVATAIRRRFDSARLIKARIEHILGETVEALWTRGE